MNTPLDLLIRNARCADNGGGRIVDIGIQGSQIVAMLEAGPSNWVSASNVVDAERRWVLPGAIDTHSHIGQTAPEYEDRPGLDPASNFASESRAALAGGVTTALNYVRFSQGSLLAAYRQQLKDAVAHSRINILFHGYVMNDTQIAEIEQAAREGIRTFKIFMPYRGREARDLGGIGSLSHAQMRLAFAEIARVGAQALVHAEDGDIVEHCTRLAQASGSSLADWETSRPTTAEGDASYTTIYLAAEQQCPVTIVHVSSLEAIRAREHIGYDQTALESCPHYLLLSTQSAIAAYGKVAPPLRAPDEAEALVHAVLEGKIDFFGSDHNVWPTESKQEMWTARAGLPGIGLLLPLLATELVANRGMSFADLTRLTSTAAAKRFGLYPSKGTLGVGADADLVILDSGTRQVRATEIPSAVDYSPYEGARLAYWPWMTVLAGQIAFRDGEFPNDNLRGDILNSPPRASDPASTPAERNQASAPLATT